MLPASPLRRTCAGLVDRQTSLKGSKAQITNIGMVDGDSIECDFQRIRVRVRLYGIDAPELRQPGGAESAENLNSMVWGSGALMMEVMGHDRCGRLIGLLYPARSNRNNSLNLRMARDGHAYAYTRFGGAELGINSAEQDAQSARRGIWRSARAGGERPWEYRNRSRKPDASMSTAMVIIVLLVVVALLAFLGVEALEYLPQLLEYVARLIG